jgi:hypothetical protein
MMQAIVPESNDSVFRHMMPAISLGLSDDGAPTPSATAVANGPRSNTLQ